ncbi:MAG: murein biosynthesis integral membrane protein MurJ [bacterium]
MCSRILGYIRDVLIADRFGASTVSDAFFAAWRIPNTLKELLGEGALTGAFIPIFTEELHTKGKEDAWILASLVFNGLLFISLVITLLGIILAPIIVVILAPGFVGKDVFSLTVTLTRIMFPFTIFICLSTLVMGILNCCRHFALPALAPAALNLCLIGSIFFLCPLFTDQPILGLSIGFLSGGLIQLLLQIPGLISKKMEYRFIFNLFHPVVKKVLLLMGPRALGSAVTQFNLTISNLLASLLIPGSISALFYSNGLVQLPLALFGVAIGTVLFPTMSKQVAESNILELKKSISWGLRMVILTSLPATIGLMVLGKPIIQLLFQHGNFDAADTNITYLALFFYSVGLLGISGLTVVVPAFYAQHDTWTPVKVGMITVVVNIIFGLLLMRPLAQGGLTLAISISSFFNLALLLAILRRKIGAIEDRRILKSLFQSLAASFIMGAFCRYIVTTELSLLLQVIIGVCGGLIILILACKVLKVVEIDSIWKLILR